MESGGTANAGAVVVRQTVNDMGEIAGNVRHAAGRLHELERASEQIVVVINVIKGVADQTNLLALNAAIEAARAEMGRSGALLCHNWLVSPHEQSSCIE